MGTFELLNAVISLFGGGLLTLWAQGRKDRHEEMQAALVRFDRIESSAVSARMHDAKWKGFYWVRGLIALLAASYFFLLPGVSVLFFSDVGVVIGYFDVSGGFWPWSSSVESVTWIKTGPSDAGRVLVYDPVKNNIMLSITAMFFGNQFARRV